MKKQPTYKISLTFALLLFTIPLIYAVFCKVNGYIILPRMFIFYSVISLIAFSVASIFVFVKAIPGGIKVMFTFLILSATVFSCLWLNGIGGHVKFEVYEGLKEIKNYNENLEGHLSAFVKEVETDDYGKFEDISHYYYRSTGIFCQLSTTTIVKYSDGNFKNAVENVNSENSWCTEAVVEDDPVPVFSFEGFDFRLTVCDNDYPKAMYFIGMNDETNEIAYVFFEDWDLDSVWDFTDLLDSYCGWRYIIKDREKNK